MKKVLKNNIKAGSRESNEPRLLGSIVSEMLHGDSPLAIGYRQYIASQENGEGDPDQPFKGFYPNTEPGVDLKLVTRKPGRLPVGDSINCMLTHDGDYHYTAVEYAVEKKVKTVQRNPIIFAGGCVNVHLQADGTKRLAFNHPRFYSHFTFRDFCLAASQELLTIARLLGEEDSDE